jgi:hypothetical protein
MSFLESIVCDVCGQVKQKSNNWHLAVSIPLSSILNIGNECERALLMVGMDEGALSSKDPFPDSRPGIAPEDVHHLCSHECMQTAVSRFHAGAPIKTKTVATLPEAPLPEVELPIGTDIS